MAGINVKRTTTDAVVLVAPHLGALRGEVGDMALVLLVPCVTEESHAGNFVLQVLVCHLADHVVHDSGALGVSTSYDDFASGSLLECLVTLANGGSVGSVIADVGHERSRIADWV